MCAHIAYYENLLSKSKFCPDIGSISVHFACSMRCLKKVIKEDAHDVSTAVVDGKSGKFFWDKHVLETLPNQRISSAFVHCDKVIKANGDNGFVGYGNGEGLHHCCGVSKDFISTLSCLARIDGKHISAPYNVNIDN